MPIQPMKKARNGFGDVAFGSYTFLVGENAKRCWVCVTCPDTAAAPMLLCLTQGADVSGQYGLIYLHKGASIILSMTGDQPWQGSLLATGVGAASYCYWTEVYLDV